jgi:hypothetical protein
VPVLDAVPLSPRLVGLPDKWFQLWEWGHKNAPLNGLFDTNQEICANSKLRNICKCARFKSNLDEIGVSVYRQKYDLRGGTRLPQSLSGLYPVQPRHRNVGNDDIRLQFPCSFDQRLTVLYPPYNLEGWFQESSDQLQKVTMVIGQEYSHFSHLSNPQGAVRQVTGFVSMAVCQLEGEGSKF